MSRDQSGAAGEHPDGEQHRAKYRKSPLAGLRWMVQNEGYESPF